MFEYWRDRLNVDEKKGYSLLYKAFTKRNYTVDCGNISATDVAQAYLAIYNDHPELFFLSHSPKIAQMQSGILGREIKNNISCRVIVEPVYSDVEIRECKKKINEVISRIKTETSRLQDEQEKIEYIASYIVINTTYEINNFFNQNAASALVFKKAQCSGISKAFKLLMDEMGLECIIINGAASDGNGINGPHSWNIVRIGKSYYHVDITFMLGANTDKSLPIKKMYLFYDDATISQNHLWDRSTAPQCMDDTKIINDFLGNAHFNESTQDVRYSEKSTSSIICDFRYGSLYEMKQAIATAIQNKTNEMTFLLDIPKISQQKLSEMIKSSCLMAINKSNASVECGISVSNEMIIKIKFTY